jgi:hypothetical protein
LLAGGVGDDRRNRVGELGPVVEGGDANTYEESEKKSQEEDI